MRDARAFARRAAASGLLPLDVGALILVNYADGRRFLAQVTNIVTPHVVIRHVDCAGRTVVDPPRTTRLFLHAGGASVLTDADNHPLATITPGWPAAPEEAHAA